MVVREEALRRRPPDPRWLPMGRRGAAAATAVVLGDGYTTDEAAKNEKSEEAARSRSRYVQNEER